MSENRKALLQEMVRFSRRFHEASRRGMDTALADLPKCHYGTLEGIYYSICEKGRDGQIYVSDLVKAMARPAPAVSRDLRVLEKEGLIARTADPDDRRKIFVRLTAKGERLRAASEDAVLSYAEGVLQRIGPERLAQLSDFMRTYERAVAEEIAARHPGAILTEKEKNTDATDF